MKQLKMRIEALKAEGIKIDTEAKSFSIREAVAISGESPVWTRRQCATRKGGYDNAKKVTVGDHEEWRIPRGDVELKLAEVLAAQVRAREAWKNPWRAYGLTTGSTKAPSR